VSVCTQLLLTIYSVLHPRVVAAGQKIMDVPLVLSDTDAVQTSEKPRAKKKRVLALDALRGMTVVNMILVDNAGAAYPAIDHSPWNGISLADATMPMFDFIVGCSVALAFSKLDKTNAGKRWGALKKAIWRFFKIFVLGVATQGGVDIFNYDVEHVRTMGILQRVAVCYLVAAVVEIYGSTLCCCFAGCRNRNPADSSHAGVFWLSIHHWAGVVVLSLLWVGIMYGVSVPSDFNEECVPGTFTPACNPQRLVDAAVLGEGHMYFPSNGGNAAEAGMTFNRMLECSKCAPGLCTAPNGSAVDYPWCTTAPFDPEGLVSQLTAAAGTLTGVHIGKVLLEFGPERHRQRLVHWCAFGAVWLFLGILFEATEWMPLNTNLFTLSFLLVTSGLGALLLSFWYVVVDVLSFDRLASPFIWVGRNAITIYVGAEAGIIQWALSIFYWGKPEKCLSNMLWPGYYWGVSSSLEQRFETPMEHEEKRGLVMAWTLGYICIWVGIAWWMDKRKIYISI
jgi:predicted acyltransferase